MMQQCSSGEPLLKPIESLGVSLGVTLQPQHVTSNNDTQTCYEVKGTRNTFNEL